MRATNTFQALCLGATLGLTGCVTVYDDGDRGYGPAPHAPAYGYDRDYDDDVEYVYDNQLDVYTVVGVPELWFSDGWYYRHSRGYWERCNRPRGGHWGRADWAYVPPRLRPRYGDDHGGGHDRDGWDRRDARRDEHPERVDWRREQRDERTDQRHDRKDARRDEHHERVDARRDDHHERVDARREARDERADWRHDRHDAKQADHHERVDAHREARDERADQRHDRHDAKQAERHERVDARHDERAERKQQRHEKRDYAGPVE